jgi:hypothetical protein
VSITLEGMRQQIMHAFTAAQLDISGAVDAEIGRQCEALSTSMPDIVKAEIERALRDEVSRLARRKIEEALRNDEKVKAAMSQCVMDAIYGRRTW